MPPDYRTRIDWIDRALSNALDSVDCPVVEFRQTPAEAPPLEILLPVFEAYEKLVACIASIQAHTAGRHCIHLLDDASTDPRIEVLGRELARTDPRFRYQRRSKNLGFVANVNRALVAGDRDVVLLNSDTRVTAHWLDRMWRSACSAERVGVVSPLSNNATALTVTHRPLAESREIDALAEVVAATSTGPVAIPTAVGFCMLIRRQLINEIGVFDEVFSPGYGEEVDFCLRAWSAGFRVLACTDAFVFHAGQASFGDRDKASWRAQHERLIASRWPDFESLMRGWWRTNPLRGQIERIAASERKKPLVVHLLHRWDSLGGTQLVTRRLIGKLDDQFDHLILVPGNGAGHWADAVRQSIAPGVELMIWNRDYLDQDWRLLGEPAALHDSHIDRLLARVLVASGARLLHVHHLLGWGTLMPTLIAKALGIETMVSLHCFHSLCPDYGQIRNGRPCGRSRAETDATCTQCLLPRLGTAGDDRLARMEDYLSRRRTLVRLNLTQASRVSAPSAFLRSRIATGMGPGLAERIEILPHGVDRQKRPRPRPVDGCLVVVYLGGLERLKGSTTLLDAAARLGPKVPITIHLYGQDGDGLGSSTWPDNCFWHGEFDPADRAGIIRQADLVVVPSLLEETFSLALSEAWAGGRPVLASDRGALSERVKEGINGWQFPAANAAALTDRLAWLASAEGRRRVHELQCRLSTDESGADFSAPYRRIYHELLGRARPDPTGAVQARVHDIPPVRIQELLNKRRGELSNEVLLGSRMSKGIRPQASIAAWITPGGMAAQLERTRQALGELPGVQEVLDPAGAIEFDWIWILKAGDQPIRQSVEAMAASLDQHRSAGLVYFDHLHVTATGQWHGAVRKAQWDPWSAASSTDLDCGWVIRRQLLDENSLTQADPPLLVEAVLKSHPELVPHHVPLLIQARPDHELKQAAKEARRRSGRIGLESAPSRAIPVVVVVDCHGPGELRLTLESLAAIAARLNGVVIVTERGPLTGDWPQHWRWLGQKAFGDDKELQAKGALRLYIRAGIALSNPDAIRRHLPCLDHSVAAIGFAIETSAWGCYGAGRILGHARDRLQPWPAWPGGPPPGWPSIRRVSGLCFDLTLADDRRLPGDTILRSLQTDESTAPVLPGDPVLLASSQLAGYSKGSLHEPGHWTTAGTDRFYSPRLSLEHGNGRTDPAALQLSVIDDDRPRVVAITPDEWASSQYRVRQPLQALVERGDIAPPVIISTNVHSLPNPAEWRRLAPEVLIVHHCFDQRLQARVRQAAPNVRIICLVDDLLTDLPAYNPFRQHQGPNMPDRLAEHLATADLIIATTAELARHMAPLGPPIQVIENALPEEQWNTLCSDPTRNGGRLRVGWAGAQQHEGDLRWLKPIVRATADQVDWVLFGMCPAYLRPWVREAWPAVRFGDYPQALNSLGLDVAVAPLVDNPFNRCKSALKLLEFGRLGIAVIASDLPPYRSAPVIRPPDVHAWVRAILNYAAAPSRAVDDGARLRDWVLDHHMLAPRLNQWQAALVPRNHVRTGQLESSSCQT